MIGKFWSTPLHWLSILLLVAAAQPGFSQNPLQRQFREVASSLNAKVGVYALNIETGEAFAWNGEQRFPMQSVYKFPIAMAILRRVDEGTLSLTQLIRVDKAEYIPNGGHSPLRDKFPEGVELTLRELLRYNSSESDGTACDVLLRLLGGPKVAEQYLRRLGIANVAIATTEMVQVANDTIQYRNWATPEAMAQLFKLFYTSRALSAKSKALLRDDLSVSSPRFDRRLKALLPAGTAIMHKTGTAGTVNGLTRATNDAGIITLPGGRHLAIAVFIADSFDSQTQREQAIARISRAAFDYWAKPGQQRRKS